MSGATNCIFFKILICVLIHMFLPAQVVLFLSCMHLLLVFITPLAILGCWHGFLAVVCVGLHPWRGLDCGSFVSTASPWGGLRWGANIYTSSPGFPWVYPDPLEKFSKAFLSFPFTLGHFLHSLCARHLEQPFIYSRLPVPTLFASRHGCISPFLPFNRILGRRETRGKRRCLMWHFKQKAL